MIDIKSVRSDWEAVADNLARRGVARENVEQLFQLDEAWRSLTVQVEELRARQNEANDSIAAASADEKGELITKMREVSKQLKEKESALEEIAKAREATWLKLPNIPAADVPDGGEGDYEILREGPTKVKERDFKIKSYLELGEGWLFNLTEAARVSGSGFTYITGDLARLQMGMVSWVFDMLDKVGFVPVIPPVLVSERTMANMGYLDHHGEEIYHLPQDGLYLVGTSEQSLGPMQVRKKQPASQLPKRYVGYSSCFRREAGSHGKDVRGLLRLHQFEKIEMFSFTTPEQSNAELEFLLKQQENIMTALELPYRVIKLAAKDLGAPSAKTYDIETWMPGEGRYRETHSTSTTTDYQARRLNIRVQDAAGTRPLHMLNGTALAMSRIFIALLENHQQTDGSINLPAALHPYLPFTKIDKH